jgi:F0F1-type ATP synthase assembly protein I
MATTGTTLIFLAIFAVIIGGKSIYVHTFFELLAANIVIHLGLILTKKFESSYAILEFVLDVSYIIVVLVGFGLIFDWFSSVPIWYLVIMAVAVYAFGVFINITRIRKEADELNKLLQKHKNKNNNTVT